MRTEAVRKIVYDIMTTTFTAPCGTEYRARYNGWVFSWMRSKRILGQVRTNSTWKVIRISKAHAQHSEIEHIVDTIRHEVAHAMAIDLYGCYDHGITWKQCAVACGANPERYACDVDMGVSKYTLTCPNCGDEVKKHRRPKRNQACSNCCDKLNGGKYTEAFKFKITQNY